MLAMAAAVAVDTVGFGAPAEANGRGLGGMVRECGLCGTGLALSSMVLLSYLCTTY
jgi:hypothetical protein